MTIYLILLVIIVVYLPYNVSFPQLFLYYLLLYLIHIIFVTLYKSNQNTSDVCFCVLDTHNTKCCMFIKISSQQFTVENYTYH